MNDGRGPTDVTPRRADAAHPANRVAQAARDDDDRPSLRQLVLGSVLAWGSVGALAMLFLTDRFSSEVQNPRISGTLAPTLLYVALWAVQTSPILLIGARFPLSVTRWGVAAWMHAVLLAATVVGFAVLHLMAYAFVAVALERAVSVANLSDAWLFYLGRLRENLVVGTMLLAGQHVLSRRRAGRRRELERAQLAAQLAEARLHALSMELRPHFLFNTLNAISGMVWADQAKADTMVVQLSELLRRTLEAGQSPTTTLADERDVLQLYLAIQQVRFGDRLTLTVHVPPELENAEVPRFLLQPLVENAFQHGLAPKRGSVSLDVAAERDGPNVVLRVSDDGVGLPPASELVESTGVGNMRRRLAALHGDAASLSLESGLTGGTTVRVRIPLRLMPTTDTPNA